MALYRCVSNNPSIEGAGIPHAEYLQLDLLSLFTYIEGELGKGYRLLSHPLSGNIRPDQSPYKSVLLTARPKARDEESLVLMEGAKRYAASLLSSHTPYQWSAAALSDFALVDLDIIKTAIHSCY